MAYKNKEARNARDRDRRARTRAAFGIAPRVKVKTQLSFTSAHKLNEFASVHRFLEKVGFTNIENRASTDRSAFECLIGLFKDHHPDCIFTDLNDAFAYLTDRGIMKPEHVNKSKNTLIGDMQVNSNYSATNKWDARQPVHAIEVKAKGMKEGEMEIMLKIQDAQARGDLKEVKRLEAIVREIHGLPPLPDDEKPSGDDLMEPGQQAPDQMAGMKDMFNSGSRPEGVE